MLIARRGTGCPKIIPLNEPAAFCIDLLRAGDPPEAMARAAAPRYNKPAESILPELLAFLQKLEQLGVLIRDED